VNSVASKVVTPTRVAGVPLASREKSPKIVTPTDPDRGKKQQDNVESMRQSSLPTSLQSPIFVDVIMIADASKKSAIAHIKKHVKYTDFLKLLS
jgi:hypothetical protein